MRWPARWHTRDMNRIDSGSGPREPSDDRKDRLIRAVVVALVAAAAVLAASGLLPWIAAGALTLAGAAALNYSPPRRRLRAAQAAAAAAARAQRAPRSGSSGAKRRPRRGRSGGRR
jgi:hypothetical protein